MQERLIALRQYEWEVILLKLDLIAGTGQLVHPCVNPREDIDFYYWLSGNLNIAEMYQHYAREIRYMDQG